MWTKTAADILKKTNRPTTSNTDPRLVAAIVDRVTFNAHPLKTSTQSYRLRTSKNTRRQAS